MVPWESHVMLPVPWISHDSLPLGAVTVTEPLIVKSAPDSLFTFVGSPSAVIFTLRLVPIASGTVHG